MIIAERMPRAKLAHACTPSCKLSETATRERKLGEVHLHIGESAAVQEQEQAKCHDHR
jgi:hypothetical protein